MHALEKFKAKLIVVSSEGSCEIFKTQSAKGENSRSGPWINDLGGQQIIFLVHEKKTHIIQNVLEGKRFVLMLDPRSYYG
jgi:hypothetical protein